MRGPACVLSLLVPGTGQLVLGRKVRGLVLAGLSLVMPVLIVFVGVSALWIWMALRPIAAIEVWIGPVGRPRARDAWIAGLGQLAGLVLVRMFVVESFRVASPSMEPTLRAGDRIFVEKLGSPARGDVILFDDPCGGATRWIKRVVALGGDTVELRCGTLYVNGAALPQQSLGPYTYDEPGPTKTERVRAARYREGDHEILEDEQRPGLDAARATATDYFEQADAHDFPPVSGTVTACGAVPLTFDRTIDRPVRACDPQLHYTVPPGDVFVLGDNREESVDSRDWGGFPASLVRGRYVATWAHR